jgi:hypothetical protein
MVMLFHGFSIHNKGGNRVNPWPAHPFNRANNINGINGDINGNGEGEELHTLSNIAVMKLQEAYVRRVIDTVNDLDVLYEIANESPRNSQAWQYHMINFIHQYGKRKPKQNPVVMTAMWDGEPDPAKDNSGLFASPAEAIAPGRGELAEYRDDPPPATGEKVIFNDTDHLWGTGGNAEWVWKSFMRGLNPIFMDPIGDPNYEPVRVALGQTLTVAKHIGLANMIPRPDLSSSGYCLANSGREYLVYLPSSSHWVESRVRALMQATHFSWKVSRALEYGRALVHLSVDVDLSMTSDRFHVTWFSPSSGEFIQGSQIYGGVKTSFKAPFSGPAVLHLAKASSPL